MTTRVAGIVGAGVFVLGCVLAAGVGAQQAGQQQAPPTVKAVPCTPIASVEGKDNFDAYCAVCHGKDAKGNGPAAPALKAFVPDLTTYASRHAGKFDQIAVERIIRGVDKTIKTPVHGVEDMPIWGEVFRAGDPSAATLRVHNLMKYLETLQRAGTEALPR
jgi:cytochrome c5